MSVVGSFTLHFSRTTRHQEGATVLLLAWWWLSLLALHVPTCAAVGRIFGGQMGAGVMVMVAPTVLRSDVLVLLSWVCLIGLKTPRT